jgi:hypothetical protein
LRRAVSHANFGKPRFRTEHGQKIWGEYSCLMTHCIIYYKAAILSNLLAYQEKIEGVALQQVSPVAWQHVNLQGRF